MIMFHFCRSLCSLGQMALNRQMVEHADMEGQVQFGRGARKVLLAVEVFWKIGIDV